MILCEKEIHDGIILSTRDSPLRTKTSRTCIDFPQSSFIHLNFGGQNSISPLVLGNEVGNLVLFENQAGDLCRPLYSTSSDHLPESTRGRGAFGDGGFFLHCSVHLCLYGFIRENCSRRERRLSRNLYRGGLNEIALRGGCRNYWGSVGRCNLLLVYYTTVITGVWGGEKLLNLWSVSLNDPGCGGTSVLEDL
jgi:hypothetical protein